MINRRAIATIGFSCGTRSIAAIGMYCVLTAAQPLPDPMQAYASVIHRTDAISEDEKRDGVVVQRDYTTAGYVSTAATSVSVYDDPQHAAMEPRTTTVGVQAHLDTVRVYFLPEGVTVT